MKKTVNQLLKLLLVLIAITSAISCKKDGSLVDNSKNRLEFKQQALENRGFRLQETLSNNSIVAYEKSDTLIILNKKFYLSSNRSSLNLRSYVKKYKMVPSESIQSGLMQQVAPDFINDSGGSDGLSFNVYGGYGNDNIAYIMIVNEPGHSFSYALLPQNNYNLWATSSGYIDIDITFADAGVAEIGMLEDAINADPVESFRYR